MPLGFVSDDDFAAEAAALCGKKSSIEISEIARGRGNADAVPMVVREFIASESIEANGNHKEIGRALGVSTSSVSAYANGATSTTTYKDGNDRLKNHVDAIKERIIKKANSKLISALNSMTQDKLDDSDAKSLSGIAKDMATTIEKLSPKANPLSDETNVHLHIYSPRMKELKDYEIIDV